MKNEKILDLCFKYEILAEKYVLKYNENRLDQYFLLKEKYIKKINNFLYRFFDLKSNPNYIIESSLNSNIKIYKVISNKNIPVIEIEFTKDLNSKLFTNLQIKIQGSIIKDNDNLEKNVTLGKISKILLNKKDIILKKYNNYILSWEKNRNILRHKIFKLKDKILKFATKRSFYRFQWVKKNIFTKKGISCPHPVYIKSELIYPKTLERIDTIKCKYLRNKKIEIIFTSKEYNKKYTYIISQEVFDELILDAFKNLKYISNLDPIVLKRVQEYRKDNLAT